MATITDLTWEGFATALAEIVGDSQVVIQSSNDGVQAIDIKLLIGEIEEISPIDGGVVKAIDRLLEACYVAQERANDNMPDEERLASFVAPIESTPIDGYVPITRTMVSRADLSSVTRIIGSNT